MIITNLILYYSLGYIYIFLLGFLFTLTFLLIFNGYLGINMQNKLQIYNKQWFNKILILFIMFYLIGIIYIKNYIILLEDSSVIICMENTDVTIKGQLIGDAFKQIGASGAFATGAKIAHSIFAKTNMHVLGKLTTILGVGAGSSIVSTVTSANTSSLASAGSPLGASTAVSLAENVTNSKSWILNNIFTLNINQVKVSLPYFDTKFNNNNLIVKTQSEGSKVIEGLENYTSKSLENILPVENIGQTAAIQPSKATTIINSPLEPSEFLSLEIKDRLISLFSDILSLHYIMVYLIWMLIFIYTIKLISDQNLYTPNWENKVRSLPLGKYIHIVITKLITTWKTSNNYWIYFILFFLFIFMCCSTFVIHVSLLTLQSM